jgi:hypothetical protein
MDIPARELPHKWRQGSVIPRSAALELGLVSTEDTSQFAIVVTHDCDCVAEESQEPSVEVIIGSQLSRLDGNLTFGKSPRKLHIALSQCGKSIELSMATKRGLDKAVLVRFEPDKSWVLSPQEKRVLSIWLGSRYSRAAFPDELERRLEAVWDVFRGAAKKHGGSTIAIFVQFDPHDEILDMTEPYSLDLSLVYDSTRSDAPGSAALLADATRQIFEKVYRRPDGSWESIELQSCEAVPDTEFTYFEQMRSRQFRFDDLSLRKASTSVLPPS